MDGLGYFLLVVVACSTAEPVMEVRQTTTVASTIKETPAPTVETSTPSLNVTCTTARNVDGACVMRVYCDHGTAAIDSTLYATRSYVQTCKTGEVCCPFAAIVSDSSSSSSNTQHTTPRTDDDTAFDFDEDD